MQAEYHRSAAINLSPALDRLGDDRELLRELAAFYLEDVPGLLQNLKNGFQTSDQELVVLSAHSIKGLSANFEAKPAMSLALQIEMAARENDLASALVNVSELESEVARVIEALRCELL